ncbi:unnamed protein product [Linum tenue]|uniref:Uncharacterized protein n=1 Tax=Linum tenue TaxID=586396 RepID=A0AAV0IZL4_9ROSI|nr:unnamed protein product [Linum tenue]
MKFLGVAALPHQNPVPELKSSNVGGGREAYRQRPETVSPTPSALTEMSPRACSVHFKDYSFSIAEQPTVRLLRRDVETLYFPVLAIPSPSPRRRGPLLGIHEG